MSLQRLVSGRVPARHQHWRPVYRNRTNVYSGGTEIRVKHEVKGAYAWRYMRSAKSGSKVPVILSAWQFLVPTRPKTLWISVLKGLQFSSGCNDYELRVNKQTLCGRQAGPKPYLVLPIHKNEWRVLLLLLIVTRHYVHLGEYNNWLEILYTN